MSDHEQVTDGPDAASIDASPKGAAAKTPYAAPTVETLGNTTALVQGGGGMSGSDRAYYYYRLPGE